MSDDTAKYAARRGAAVARYERQVAFLEKTKQDARRRYYAAQTIVIISTSWTPVVIVAGAPQWLQLAGPALAVHNVADLHNIRRSLHIIAVADRS
jgi:hypothetical protein